MYTVKRWHRINPFLTSGLASLVRVMYTPLEPHFYIAKLGYAGVGLFFLVLLQNIDRRGGSNVYPQSMF